MKKILFYTIVGLFSIVQIIDARRSQKKVKGKTAFSCNCSKKNSEIEKKQYHRCCFCNKGKNETKTGCSGCSGCKCSESKN